MAEREMPYRDIWFRELAGLLGALPAHNLMERVEAQYAALYEARAHYGHPALRAHLEDNILPGLALYRALRQDGHHEQAALKTVERMFAASMGPRRRQLARLGRLPFFFGLLRIVTRWIMAHSYPAAGWEVSWPREGHDVVAFDMHSCFYLTVLTEYGAPELAPVYCRLDDLLYDDLWPGVRWQRTGTLGRGDDCCDFRFYRE
ncbi:MAG: L-2-amino-thiazoline-4-carboxylic acid hydrolase [Anaerolineae bacterium]|nr:L-2-amino-thiazoline-4-carboxylic acid hydrolase [Anaerolineae bacterium]